MTNKQYAPTYLPEGGSYVKQIATMERPLKPVSDKYRGSDGKFHGDAYSSDLHHWSCNTDIYNSHLASPLQYPMPSMTEEFGKREVVELDVDFELMESCWERGKDGQEYLIPIRFIAIELKQRGLTINPSPVAIPLPAPAVEDSGEEVNWQEEFAIAESRLVDEQNEVAELKEKLNKIEVIATENYSSEPTVFDDILDIISDETPASTTPQQESKGVEQEKAMMFYLLLTAGYIREDKIEEARSIAKQFASTETELEQAFLRRALDTYRKTGGNVVVYPASKGVDEVERLLALLEREVKMRTYSRMENEGYRTDEEEIEEVKKSWQQFKTDNNL